MKKIISLLFFLPFLIIKSQTIKMNFPYFGGKTFDFIIFQGDKQIKVAQDTIPVNGKFELKIPKEYAPYTGMSRWLLTNSTEGGGLDMVISGKDFSVSCMVKTPSKQEDFVYTGNTDNELLNSLFAEQQSIVNKGNAIKNVLNIFDKSEKNYPIFEQEYGKLKKDYILFQQKVSMNRSYAGRVFNIFGIVSGTGTELTRTDKEWSENIASYVADKLDFNVLYTSGHWTNIISNWVEIHTSVLKNKNIFVTDFATIEKKMDTKLFTDFAGRVAYFLTQKGKDDYITALSPIVKKSSKILTYEGSMLAYTKATIGSPAPDIISLEHIGNPEEHNHNTNILESKNFASGNYEKTLLIFYESGCGPCENLLQQLPGNYENLKKKGVRIIAISADTDEKVFKSKAKNFPWKDTYCDYKGMAGINFQNYGVNGTPTMFLIDKSGKIEYKMAGLDELLSLLK